MSKSIQKLATCALALVASAATSFATVLLQDSFPATPGPLVGTTPAVGGAWTVSGATSTDEIQVISGSLPAPTGMTPSTGNAISWGNSGEDAQASFANQTAGTVYYGFLLNLTANSSTTSGANIMSIGNASQIVASLGIRRDSSDSTKYNVGFYEAKTFGGPHWASPQLSPGTTYFVVIGYQFVAGTNNDVISLWLNPTSFGGAAPTPTITSTNVNGEVSSLNLISLWQRDSSTPSNTEIDELRVGTTWADVAPGGDLTVSIVMDGTYNFSWTFDKPVVHGTFVDGQPWIIRPSSGLNLVATTPARQNGASVEDGAGNPITADIDMTVINPPVGTTYDASGVRHSIKSFGWDSRGCIRTALGEAYDPTLAWNGVNPVALGIGDAVTTVYSRASGVSENCLDAAAVLTVLDSAPPAGAFRPGFTRSAARRATPEWFTMADLIDLTPYLLTAPTVNLYRNPISGTIPTGYTGATLTSYLPGPSIMNIGLQDSRSANATYNNNGQTYGQGVAFELGDLAVGSLASWLSPADRATCQIHFLQRAVDTYESVKAGLSLAFNGGHLGGYAETLTIAGRMFSKLGNHPGMIAMNTPAGLPNGLQPEYYFADYSETFYMYDPAAAPGSDAPPAGSTKTVSFKSTAIDLNLQGVGVKTASTTGGVSDVTMVDNFMWPTYRAAGAVTNMKLRVDSGTGAGTTDYVVLNIYGYTDVNGNTTGVNASTPTIYRGRLTVKPNWQNGIPDATSKLTFSVASASTVDLPAWSFGGGEGPGASGGLDFSPYHGYADINAGMYETLSVALYAIQGNTYYTGGFDKFLIHVCGVNGYGEVLLNDGNSRYAATQSASKPPEGQFVGGLLLLNVLDKVGKPFVSSSGGVNDLPYPPANTALWNH